jgi:hypothetical protein
MVLFSLAAIPGIAQASPISNFVSWLVPTELKPVPVVEKTTQGVGGILITADPAIMSGDTLRTFYLPALTSRSFRIQNGGAVDLFLNKNSALTYAATPAVAPGDVPAAFSLSTGIDRTIVITNPSTTSNVYLSKIDLGITSTGSSTISQPSVFLNNARAASVAVSTSENAPAIASLTFSFTLNNATQQDIFVSRLINPLSFVTLASVPGASTSIKFIESAVKTIAGDVPNAYVIPAGSSRPFELTGIIDNTNGTAGTKTLALTEIHYSTSKNLIPVQILSGPVLLRNLSTTINLGTGNPAVVPPVTTTTPVKPVAPVVPVSPVIIEADSTTALLLIPPVLQGVDLKKPSIVVPPPIIATQSPSSTQSPSPSPSGSGTPTPSPSTIVTSSPLATPQNTATPLSSPSDSSVGSTATGSFVISLASTTVGAALVENGEVVGYPVTFSFTAKALGKTAYFSKTPSTAFITTQSGFGTILPSINNISAYPAVRTGDGGSYYIIPAETFRSFQAFAVLKSDGLAKAGTQTFQISTLNYGNRTSALTEGSTTTPNLKATVKLAPRTVRPSSSPSSSPSPSPSGTGSPSPSPSAANLIALCYAVPTNPYTGDPVLWTVMQTGGSGTPSYTWTGTEGLAGSSSQVQKRYANTGRKDALVSVVSGNQSVTATCNVNVSLQPTPSYSSSPNPSGSSTPTPTPTPISTGSSGSMSIPEESTPSPSSSDVSFGNKKDRGFIANALYGAGEWLDSLFAR